MEDGQASGLVTAEELDNWLKSVESLYFRIKKVLSSAGLKEMECIGKPVDLERHEVYSHESRR